MSADRQSRSAPGPMQRIPVTLVCGFLGAGKTTLIKRWLDHKPPSARWVVIQNEVGASGFGRAVHLVDVSAACACCAAEPVLRRELLKVAGAERCDRLIIELSGQGLPQRIADLLRSAPLADRFVLQRTIAVVAADRAGPFRRMADDDAPALANSLAIAQIEAADQVWLRPRSLHDESSPVESPTDPLIKQLRNWPPFGRSVATQASAFDEQRRFDVEHASRVATTTEQRSGGWSSLSWRWPAECKLPRQPFSQLLNEAEAAARRGVIPWALRSVLITERETYQWSLGSDLSDKQDLDGAGIRHVVSAYRSMSRIDLSWAAPERPEWVDRLDDALTRLNQ